jgi:hypothetical protein
LQDDPNKDISMTAPFSPAGFATAPSVNVINAMAGASVQLGHDIVDISGFLEGVDESAQHQLTHLKMAREAAGSVEHVSSSMLPGPAIWTAPCPG